MKHIYRKPLLPLLLMIMFLFGTCFVTLFQKSMAEACQQIDDIYNHTHIYIEAFPAGDTSETLRMNTYRGDVAAGLDEITDSMVMLQCYYSISFPFGEEIYSTVYGTNNPDVLAEIKDFRITWDDGYDREAFLNTDKQTACLMDQNLAASLGLSAGDSFVISPVFTPGQTAENAPKRTLTLAGTFRFAENTLAENALIVPNTIFLGENGLLYNSNMMTYNCFYRAYRLELDPAYNREIDNVLEKIEAKLIDSYSLITNARSMKQAIRPIEQKLLLQEMLELPLLAMFSIATAVTGLLLALSLKTETFLRFLVGESRFMVFFKMFASVFLPLVLSAVLAFLSVQLTAGAEWSSAALRYLGITSILTILAMALPLAVICSKNLVKLYQQREG